MNAIAPSRAAYFDHHFAAKIERLDNEIAALERRLPYEQAHHQTRATETAAKIRKLKLDRHNAFAFKNR